MLKDSCHHKVKSWVIALNKINNEVKKSPVLNLLICKAVNPCIMEIQTQGEVIILRELDIQSHQL